MTIFKFLTSKTFFKHLGFAFGGLAIVLIITFLILKVYTHHGQELSVPSFYGLTVEDAQKLAKKVKCALKLLILYLIITDLEEL